MKPTIKVLALAFVLLAARSAAAQAKPDFSGRWVQVTPSAVAEGGGQEQVVRQDDASVTTSHASEGGGHGQVYKFGSDSSGMLGHDVAVTSRAAWDGPKLVLTSTATYPDKSQRQTRQVWTLGSDGLLTIESTMTHPDRTITQRKSVHRKK